MLTEAKNTLKFILKSLKCNMKSAIEYKKSFITQVIFMIINDGFFLIFWNVVFAINNGNISGIEMKDILYLWSIPVLSYGIVHFFFGGLVELNRYIVNCELDTYLLQPKNMFFNIATSKSDLAAFGDIVYGTIIAIIVAGNIQNLLMIFGYTIISSIFFICIIVIGRSLAIWIGDVENIARTYEQSLYVTLSTYPQVVFGKGIKILMYTVIPAMYAVHLPIKLLGKFDIKIFAIIILAMIIFIGIAKFMFNQVLRKYESGNNIALKS